MLPNGLYEIVNQDVDLGAGGAGHQRLFISGATPLTEAAPVNVAGIATWYDQTGDVDRRKLFGQNPTLKEVEARSQETMSKDSSLDSPRVV